MTTGHSARLGAGQLRVVAKSGWKNVATTDTAPSQIVDMTEPLGPAQIQVLEDSAYGPYLANATGLALYVFSNDRDGEVTCRGACDLSWPPLLTDGLPAVESSGVTSALLGTVEGPIGTQATYNEWPLYTLTADDEAGDTLGHASQSWGGLWRLIAPDGAPIRDGMYQTERTYAPRLRVADQQIHDDLVTLLAVTSDGPGWVVIYANDNGEPGLPLGLTHVPHGATTALTIEVDPMYATEMLHAVLYQDNGTVGVYEVPTPDGPATNNGELVHKTFALDLSAASAPQISVSNQQITNEQVIIDAVVSNGPGWVAIHNNAGGYANNSTVGPIIGYSAVEDGVNREVVIDITMADATGTLYATLYQDEGAMGLFDAADHIKPVMINGEPVWQTFTVRDLSLSRE